MCTLYVDRGNRNTISDRNTNNISDNAFEGWLY